MFGDQPEAADLGRNCEICRVELELDRPLVSTVYNWGGKSLGKVGKVGDWFGRKDGDVNTDGLVTATPGMESSTGFRDAA